MSIVAALDKVLFFNASSKYSVLRMKTEDSSVPTEARSPYRYHDHLIRFTAVGIELPQTDTVKIEMDGEWKDGKYGLQLQVDHWQEIVPPTLEGVRNYLASGLLKGIGEKTADAIIEKFGVNALEILEHQPDRLLEIRGITKERLAEIKDAYAETSRMRVLMTLLAPFKVTPTTAQKIYQHFGPACADIVRQSPFNLCQVPGFGFKRIDAIVQKSGGDLRDPKRVHGALFYALEDARTKDGHLYLEAESLLKAAMQLLNERIPLPQMRVPMSQVEQELSAIIRQDEVVEPQRDSRNSASHSNTRRRGDPPACSLRRRDPGSVDSVPCSYPRTRNQSKVVFHHIAQIFHRDLILFRDTALAYDLPIAQCTAASLIP